MDLAAINDSVLRGYRAGGEIGVPGMRRERMILLTTVGRSTQRPRTTPMMFARSAEGILVVASANAAPRDPQWVLNVIAEPRVHVEAPDGEWDGVATVLEGEARELGWALAVTAAPIFTRHQARIARRIPVVEIVPES